MRTYVSCGCKWCRHVPSKIKRQHKNMAHRALRRATRRCIQNNCPDDIPQTFSTGYMD